MDAKLVKAILGVLFNSDNADITIDSSIYVQGQGQRYSNFKVEDGILTVSNPDDEVISNINVDDIKSIIIDHQDGASIQYINIML